MEATKPGEERAKPPLGAAKRRWLRGGLIALAFVVAVVAWVASRDDGDEAGPAPVESAPRIVDEDELRVIAASTGHTVYWAGPMPGRSLEAVESSDGSVVVRYQRAGVEAGEGPATVLTVASYPIADPAGAIDAVSGRPGAIVRESPDGRTVVTSEDNPRSVYFASPENGVQVEVYDPSPKRAMSLALSERVAPVG